MEESHEFYRDYYHTVMIVMVAVMLCALLLVSILLYQVFNRPIPLANAVASNGQRMVLTAYKEPNLLSTTITRWARKAAVVAYTFDFVNATEELNAARPYFTAGGWADYQASANAVIKTLKQNQLFVTGVVTAPPVITNQGDFPGHGYVWRVQVPFLVTYQSSDASHSQNYMVQMTIAKVPTSANPSGIGIDQFVMK